MILLMIAVLLSVAWTVYYYAAKIYRRRWLEAFIDSAGIFPWPLLLAFAFWLLAGLAVIWNPNAETGRRWGYAGLIVGGVALLLGWFLRAVLWAAPDVIWPENENLGKNETPPTTPAADVGKKGKK